VHGDGRDEVMLETQQRDIQRMVRAAGVVHK
jgi:hypothetical protein